jgi:hypothetical protein
LMQRTTWRPASRPRARWRSSNVLDLCATLTRGSRCPHVHPGCLRGPCGAHEDVLIRPASEGAPMSAASSFRRESLRPGFGIRRVWIRWPPRHRARTPRPPGRPCWRSRRAVSTTPILSEPEKTGSTSFGGCAPSAGVNASRRRRDRRGGSAAHSARARGGPSVSLEATFRTGRSPWAVAR